MGRDTLKKSAIEDWAVTYEVVAPTHVRDANNHYLGEGEMVIADFAMREDAMYFVDHSISGYGYFFRKRIRG